MHPRAQGRVARRQLAVRQPTRPARSALVLLALAIAATACVRHGAAAPSPHAKQVAARLVRLAEDGIGRVPRAWGPSESTARLRKVEESHHGALQALVDPPREADPVEHLEAVTDWVRLSADARALTAEGALGWMPLTLDSDRVERIHMLLLIGAMRAVRQGDLATATACFEGARAVTMAAVAGQDYGGAYLGLRLRVRELTVFAELGQPLALPPDWATSPRPANVAALALYRHARRGMELLETCEPAFIASAGSCDAAWDAVLPMVNLELSAARALETGTPSSDLDAKEAAMRRASPMARASLDTKTLRDLVAEVEAAERRAAPFVVPATAAP